MLLPRLANGVLFVFDGFFDVGKESGVVSIVPMENGEKADAIIVIPK
jgi:hypothetical protein